MVKIKLGNNEKLVTKGAYENFYEHLGYEIIDDKKPLGKEVEVKKEVEIKDEPKKEFKKEAELKGEKESYSRK